MQNIDDQHELINLHLNELVNHEVVDNEAVEDLDIFSKLIELMEIQTLLSDEDDRKDVIFINSSWSEEVKILKIGL